MHRMLCTFFLILMKLVCADTAKFPKCIGAIDCTHIRTKSPGDDDDELFIIQPSFQNTSVRWTVLTLEPNHQE